MASQSEVASVSTPGSVVSSAYAMDCFDLTSIVELSQLRTALQPFLRFTAAPTGASISEVTIKVNCISVAKMF